MEREYEGSKSDEWGGEVKPNKGAMEEQRGAKHLGVKIAKQTIERGKIEKMQKKRL